MSEVCNIGPKGIRTRVIGGLATVGLIVIVMLTDVFWTVNPLWRLWVFFPLFGVFLSLFQAQAKT